MDGDDGIAIVVVAGEQSLGLQFVYERAQSVYLAAEIGGDVFPFVRQIEIGCDVPGSTREFVMRCERVFEPLLLAHYKLRFFRI
jgi:hypothetical protein